jgi:ADP-heptose:LPS heptosyltransferase
LLEGGCDLADPPHHCENSPPSTPMSTAQSKSPVRPAKALWQGESQSGPILVIKLGALGDFILALPCLEALRRKHPDEHLILMTIPALQTLARRSGLFDEIWLDSRQGGVKGLRALLAWRRRVKRAGIGLVYDLQSTERTDIYFQALRPSPPQWCGSAWGASVRFQKRGARPIHAADHLDAQLARCGITVERQAGALDWLADDVERFGLSEPYVLLVTGSSPGRPEKRWPARCYGELAKRLVRAGYHPVLIGSEAEAETNRGIARGCSEARDLTGMTELSEIAGLAAGAAGAAGNDTGPMHLIAAMGCPTLALFSGASSPEQSAPRGRCVQILREADLGELSVAAVEQALIALPLRLHSAASRQANGSSPPFPQRR